MRVSSPLRPRRVTLPGSGTRENSAFGLLEVRVYEAALSEEALWVRVVFEAAASTLTSKSTLRFC